MGRGRWVRGAAAVACAVGVLLLSGCTLAGRVTFNADETITLDAVLSQKRSGTSDSVCDNVGVLGLDGLSAEVLDGPADRNTCRITGTLPSDQLGYLTSLVGRADGRYFVTVPGPLAERGTEDDPLTEIDLTLTFPGPVVEAAGASSVTGRSATWANVDDVLSEGVMVVALDRDGVPPVWLAAGLAGAAGVAVGAGAAVFAARRGWLSTRGPGDRDQSVPALDVGIPDAASDPAPPGAPLEPDDDPTMWARPE